MFDLEIIKGIISKNKGKNISKEIDRKAAEDNSRSA